MQIVNEILNVKTDKQITVINLNDAINSVIKSASIKNGFAVISSRHTTTAITINEHEERLLEDIKQWLHTLAPTNLKYLHNDIHLRDCPPDEPENAHSHLMAMLLGSSESVPIVDGQLAIGQYQSVMLFDLDGPRQRTVNIQVMGECA